MLFFIIFNKSATNDVKELRTPLLTPENLEFPQVALKITGHLTASLFFSVGVVISDRSRSRKTSSH